jgi:hypothetical protein
VNKRKQKKEIKASEPAIFVGVSSVEVRLDSWGDGQREQITSGSGYVDLHCPDSRVVVRAAMFSFVHKFEDDRACDGNFDFKFIGDDVKFRQHEAEVRKRILEAVEAAGTKLDFDGQFPTTRMVR